MLNCRKHRSLFVNALYDELSPEQKVSLDAHLKACPKCAAAFEKMSSTLGVMEKRRREEPEEDFWTGYWDRLAERLVEPETIPEKAEVWWKRFVQTLTHQPNWAIGTAGAVGLILIGIFIGKLVFGPGGMNQQSPRLVADVSSRAAEKVSLESRTEHYLQRSKVLLLGLINFDPETEDSYILNLPQQREISQDLVQEANYLKNELTRRADKQLLQLVTDLEVILLQIANLEAGHDLSAVEMVKSGVDRRGILLKLDLEEMRRTDKNLSSETREKENI
jgi:hypothetical protein